ncbi:hypothetical protein [Paracoccus aestuariivivens]|uniref:Uncharacterized protein n=1 Tax=Paracoccus aestuariivivens TaxID=1820333 RepID=A0A6L6JB59_9RHOB|nr:hypothetical protein [Paracoccus aestuariivivens]MTH78746.1 hypothetical protein [Paracoccus aestuariivivens]
MSKTYKLKLTSAVVVNGAPARAGSVVEVDDRMARRLLDAGKADLATIDDVELGDEDEAAAEAEAAKAEAEAKAAVEAAKTKPKEGGK